MQVTQRQILLVDDNQDTCEMMLLWFSPTHYRVTTAQTMTEGWRLAQSKHFDLCLLESQLPDGSGYELCQRICAITPDVPVVFYSACAYEKDRQQGLAAGGRAYLVKPDDLMRIEEVIGKLIAEVREQDLSSATS
ncbi:MAG TPA: response regulator [Blastocatellia bacterium]|nr:response regulator [Blastocatellia bacterium]